MKKHLDPKAVWLFFFSMMWVWIFLGFIFFTSFLPILFTSESILASILYLPFIPLIIVGGLAYAWARLSYKYYMYELTDDGFRKEHGVIWKKYVTIPYDRIQNVDIMRGPISRILGLSDLNIQTAGYSAQVSRYGVHGSGAEGRLPGVSQKEAEELRDELIKRAKHTSRQGL